METLPSPHLTHPGLLIAIGGAEDKTRERVILRYFLESSGGSDANIVVLATASEVPETGERYAELFYSLRAETVEVLDRKSTRLNSSHLVISYAVLCLKKKNFRSSFSESAPLSEHPTSYCCTIENRGQP